MSPDENGSLALLINEYGFVLFLSLIIPVLALIVSYVLVSSWERLRKRRRPVNGPSPIHIPCASASTDLIPLFDRLPKHSGITFNGSQLWLFGCDGSYLVKSKGKRWLRYLSRWVKEGLSVRYIFLDVNEDARSKLEELKSEVGGDFEALVLKKNIKVDEALLNELETCHPNLFFGNNNENASWIEGLHRRDSVFAYNVLYTSPQAMRGHEERKSFESYTAKLQKLSDCCSSIFNSKGIA